MIKNKRYGLVLMALACALVLSACGTRNGSADDGKEIINAYVGDDHTEIKVSHAVSGQIFEATLTGDGIAGLKSWMKDLKLEKKQFEEGNTPGDADGGEMYAFEMTGGKYSEFAYIKNGSEDCYLSIGNEWYAVTNPSDPPIVQKK